MRDAVIDVTKFHAATGTPVLFKPTVPKQPAIERRVELIEEEFLETMKALGYAYNISRSGGTPDTVKKVQYTDPDLVQLADGLADLIYTAIGTALEFGIPLVRVWDEVQRSNMAKRDLETGRVVKNEFGKILKPSGWTPPDIEKALGPIGSSQ